MVKSVNNLLSNYKYGQLATSKATTFLCRLSIGNHKKTINIAKRHKSKENNTTWLKEG